MKVTWQTLEDLLHDNNAAGAIEYALLAALIALAAFVAMHDFGRKVVKDYRRIGKRL